MHASVYGADEPHLLGNLDVWKSKGDWSSLIICPSRDHSNKDQEKHLLLSGTPNLAFKVQVESSVLGIVLNKPLTFDLGPYESIKVFQFIPTEDISDKQLDVTVTSESDVSAYLKVSRDCEDVNENIDVVDYRGESIRLSFAKKGRITLSRVSIPPLTDSTSSWFIGIAIKNATGETPAEATKSVTLTLKRSFDYSYFWPIFLLVVLSVVLGAALACCGVRCFPIASSKEWTRIQLDDKPAQQTTPSTQISQGKVGKVPEGESGAEPDALAKATIPMQPNEKTPLIQTSQRKVEKEVPEGESGAEPDALAKATIPMQPNEKTPLIQTSQRKVEKEVPEGESGAEPDALAKATIPMQPDEKTPLTQTSQRKVGKEDPEGESGAESDALAQTTIPMQPDEKTPLTQTSQRWVMEDVMRNWFKRGPKTYSYITGIVGFVLMIGAGQFVFANWHLMIQEGDRDTCYYNDFCYRVSHLADIPLNLMISNLTYMIHGLILAISVMYMEAKLFSCYRNSNDLPPKHAFSMGYAFAWALFFEGCFSLVYHLCPSELTFQFDTGFMFVIAGLIVVLLYNGIEMKENSGERGFVDAANFFLYFLVPLYIFNYFGTLSHSETGLVNAPAFFIFAAIWWISITFWTGWKLFPDFSSCSDIKKNCCKCFWFFLGFFLPFILCGVFSSNIPQAFLFTCIIEGTIAIIVNALCNWKKIKWEKWEESKCKVCSQVAYFVVIVILWGFAVWIFQGKETTDKSLTPEKSRDYNQDCFLDIFDYHDLWHILSSHALLMSAYVVMFMSHKGGDVVIYFL